jgi:general secretion pathway protein G
LPDALADASLDAKVDPCGRPYQNFNLRTSKGNGQPRKDKKLAPLNSDFDLYSVGPDGLTAASLANNNSRDDVVRARDGGFLGTAEEFDP